jgi:hypothetical protein
MSGIYDTDAQVIATDLVRLLDELYTAAAVDRTP